MNRLAVVGLLILLSGCRTADAVSRSYDLSKVKRVGILRFDYRGREPFGIEDIVAKHMLDKGYRVVERVRLESIMEEQELSLTGILSPDRPAEIGRILGVDAVVIGQLTSYTPQRKMLMKVDSRTTREVPIFEDVREKNAEGKMVAVRRMVGMKIKSVDKEIPFMMPVDAEVGLAIKLVDVETGEVVWVGSKETQAENAAVAADWLASYLVKRLSKKWRAAE